MLIISGRPFAFGSLVFFLLLLIALAAGCARPVITTQPEETLAKYLKAWQWADSQGMYDLLSSQDQNLVTAAEYAVDLEEMPRPVSYKITGSRLRRQEARIQVELTLQALADQENNKIMTTVKKADFFLVREKDSWKVSEVKTFKDW